MNFKVKNILLATVVTFGVGACIATGIHDLNKIESLESELNKNKKNNQLLKESNQELYNENNQLKVDITNQNKVIVSKDDAMKKKHARLLYVKNVKNERIEYLKRELKKKPKVVYKTEYKERIVYKKAGNKNNVVSKKPQTNVQKENKKEVSQVSKKSEEVPTTNNTGRSFQMTSYTADCSGCSGVTATGLNVKGTTTHNGMRIIAVDPSVIPLGSTVRVTTGSSSFLATAQDTGGAIKGNIIDLLVSSSSQAQSNGRQQVKVQILN